MVLKSLKLSVFCGLAALTLTACSSGDDLGVTTSWLGPLHNYERISGEENDGVFILRGNKPVTAERIFLAPAEITISADSDLNSVTPRAYERIRSAFADALARELSKQPNKTSDDASAYFVRIALTGLTAKRIGKDAGAATLSDLKFSFDISAIEAELRNRQTNTRNAVIVFPARAATTEAGGLPTVFESLAQRVYARISDARAALDKRAQAPAPAAPAAGK
ncbi:MAG: hypothetical protein ACPGRZ_16050 [Alphaproteobacteria bacterium]